MGCELIAEPCPHGWAKRSFCQVCRITDASDPVPKFVGVRDAVMRGSQWIATACSRTMAQRIANALNKHVPNRKGV